MAVYNTLVPVVPLVEAASGQRAIIKIKAMLRQADFEPYEDGSDQADNVVSVVALVEAHSEDAAISKLISALETAGFAVYRKDPPIAAHAFLSEPGAQDAQIR